MAAKLTPQLKSALNTLAGMQHPSVAGILKAHGYRYEAGVITKLLYEWRQANANDTRSAASGDDSPERLDSNR